MDVEESRCGDIEDSMRNCKENADEHPVEDEATQTDADENDDSEQLQREADDAMQVDAGTAVLPDEDVEETQKDSEDVLEETQPDSPDASLVDAPSNPAAPESEVRESTSFINAAA